MQVVGSVAEVIRYPVKSMQGEGLEAAVLAAGAGVEGDRRFAVRDAASGKVGSAKDPRRWGQLLACRASIGAGGLEVSLPGGRTFASRGPDLDAALSAMLGRPVTVDEAAVGRLGSYDSTWPAVEGLTLEGDHEFPVAMGTQATSFVDVSGVHLITSATISRLEALLPDGVVDVRRFRPNIVLDTGALPDGFQEDGWSGGTLRIGGAVELTGLYPTPRCVMTTLAQPGLDAEPRMLRVLAAHNRRTLGGGSFACAGITGEVGAGGEVAVGDTVTWIPAG